MRLFLRVCWTQRVHRLNHDLFTPGIRCALQHIWKNRRPDVVILATVIEGKLQPLTSFGHWQPTYETYRNDWHVHLDGKVEKEGRGSLHGLPTGKRAGPFYMDHQRAAVTLEPAL